MIITKVHEVEIDLDEMITVLESSEKITVPIERKYIIEIHQELKQKRDALDWIAEIISGWKSSGYLQYGKWAREDEEFETLWKLLDLLVEFIDE